MYTVTMKTISAGPEGTFGIGDKCEVSEAEARMLVEGGFAECAVLQVPKQPQIAPEKAIIKPEQVATLPTPKVEVKTAAPEAPWGKKQL